MFRCAQHDKLQHCAERKVNSPFFAFHQQKKEDSSRNPPFSCRQQLLGSGFGCGLGSSALLAAAGRIALLALAAAGGLGSSLDGGLIGGLGGLRSVTAAAYHGGSSQNYNERKNLFHSFKRLKLVSYIAAKLGNRAV